MWKKVGACCVALALPPIWGACAGETLVDANEKLPCDTSDECPQGEHDESQCVGWKCECPDPDEEFCCDPGAKDNECNGHCRPTAECDAEPCKEAEDCTGPVDSRCGEAACNRGLCDLRIVGKFSSQLYGDCKEMFCDTTGRVITKDDSTDAFDDLNECTVDTCKNSDIANVPLPAGRAPDTTTAFCDGTGRLVECTEDENCADPAIACSPRGACVPSSCKNGVKDTVWGETAIDCGGRCDPCSFGQACESNVDCADQVCGSDKKCKEPICDDHIKNGGESDIDCGSENCGPCSFSKRCHAHDDCDSDVCIGGECQETSCQDGVRNGLEHDIDCGGVQCQACPLYLVHDE